MAYIAVPHVILPKQPGDFIALYRSKFYLLEAKSTHAVSFSMEHIREHQRRALMAVARAGGRGILPISFRRKRPVRCYALDYFHYEVLEAALREERKSVPENAIAEVSIQLKRVPRVGWDLEPIFES